jgi:hypothetical protein
MQHLHQSAFLCMLRGLPVVTLTLATCNHTQLRISLSCLHLHALPASASTAIAAWTPAPPTRDAFQCIACTSQHQHALPASASTTLISKHRRFQVWCHQSCATEWHRCIATRAVAGDVGKRHTATATAWQERPSNIRSKCSTTHTVVPVHALSHRHATTMHERATRHERRTCAASTRNAEARRNNSMLCTQQHALHASECPACTSKAC